MNENNQQEPNINKLIEEGEEMNENPQSFFKKPTGVAIIILAIIILTALIFIPRTDRITDNNLLTQPLSTEDKLEILDRLSKDNSIPQISNEEKLNILEELSKQQENTTTNNTNQTQQEKLEILNSLSN